MDDLKNEIEQIKDELVGIRRYLHQNAEVGFDIPNTFLFVWNKLIEYGYTPIKCGKSGIIVNVFKNQKKTILMRADMDALPISEETALEYKADFNMHACGHDLHTTILLGTAKLLQKYKNKLNYNIRFMFQPAEEILSGAKDMIEDGVLNDIDMAFMCHVVTGTDLKTGEYIISNSQMVAPSCDYFEININGKGCHGATPHLGNDPIMIAVHILEGLTHIQTREINHTDDLILTYGSINGGNSYNVIPSKLNIKGTIRTFNEELRMYLKKRMEEIVTNIANAYNVTARIDYAMSTPVLVNDKDLVNRICNIFKDKISISENLTNSSKSLGSEDFAYLSQKIPSAMINISAGSVQDGYNIPLHNSKVIFDENVIENGVYLFIKLILEI